MGGYRLTRSKYSAFSGTGSLFANGRWHWAGVPMVYCAGIRALAVLEALVHTKKDQIPSDYVFYEGLVDDSTVKTLTRDELPAGWRAVQRDDARALGSACIQSRTSACPVVPSVVIPKEDNLLLNPEHRNSAPYIRTSTPQKFEWNVRLFK